MSGKQHDGDPFAHSMTDLMAGVAVTFLLIAAIFMVQERKHQEAEARKSAATAKELEKYKGTAQEAKDELKALHDELLRDESLREAVEVLYDPKKDPYLLTVVFDRGRLRFDPGDCAIRDDTREAMASSFKAIFRHVCETAQSGFIQSITLEGHTDNRPFFPAERGCGVEPARGRCSEGRVLSPDCVATGFANNVRLSAARAQNVFFEMRSILQGDQKVTACLDTNFVVAGRGPVDPADGKSWDTARTEPENERNRRVVIKVRATSLRTEGAS